MNLTYILHLYQVSVGPYTMTTILIPYLIAITLLTLTPGLDTTLIIRTATLEGKSKRFKQLLELVLAVLLGALSWHAV